MNLSRTRIASPSIIVATAMVSFIQVSAQRPQERTQGIQKSMLGSSCDAVHINKASLQGNLQFSYSFVVLLRLQHIFIVDVGRSKLWFSTITQMRRAAEGGKLASALTAVNCLAIAAATNEPEEASALIDLVKALKVEKKELLIFTEGTDLSSWPTLNKSINFNVAIIPYHGRTSREAAGAGFN